jgi:hypothetical protein
MKKLFMTIPLLGYSLTYPDFSLCYEKYKNYSIIPISEHYSITSKRPKNYIKYDRKYRIYLIKRENKNYLHFKNSKLGMWLASIKNGAIYVGNYAEFPTKYYPAKLSTKTTPASIISDTFCNPIGIGVNGGFLTANEIQKYIHKNITKKYKIIKRKRKRKYSSQGKYSYIFKDLGIVVSKTLGVIKIIPHSWAAKKYIPKWSHITKINGKRVHSINDIKTPLPKSFKITFRDINGNEWSGYYYKGK